MHRRFKVPNWVFFPSISRRPVSRCSRFVTGASIVNDFTQPRSLQRSGARTSYKPLWRCELQPSPTNAQSARVSTSGQTNSCPRPTMTLRYILGSPYVPDPRGNIFVKDLAELQDEEVPMRQYLRHLMIAIALAIVFRRCIRQFAVSLLRPVKARCQRSSGKHGDVLHRSGIRYARRSVRPPDLDYRRRHGRSDPGKKGSVYWFLAGPRPV
jgi:hypothetical protein